MIINIISEDAARLPVYFHTISSRHNQEDVVRPNGLNVCQLLFVLGGEGMLSVSGKEHRLARGTAFYVSSGVAHSYCGEGLTTAWITFRGDGVEAIKHYATDESVVFHSTNVGEYALMIEDMEREYFGKKRECILSSMAYGVITAFFDEAQRTDVSDIDAALAYMEEHFATDITLAKLCSVCCMGHSSFSKKFKERFGMSAFEKLIEIRLINADMMLTHLPTKKVSAIAHECGFSDVGYFSKAYKRKFGKTPRTR